MTLKLNRTAHHLCDAVIRDPDRYRAVVRRLVDGATLIDLGVEAVGGLEAGLLLARVCTAGLAEVALACPSRRDAEPCVTVYTDHPLAACMAAQYAGWRLAEGDFLAMGSGPMRAAAASEELFTKIGHTERADVAVGALEAPALPPPSLVTEIAARCGVPARALTLLVARTSSLAGTVQVVARSLETALHKLYEMEYPLERIVSGYGTAPLPPAAADDLTAIGRTNDAILYGGQVVLWVRDEDETLKALGPRLPSSASADFGTSFLEIYARYDGDFYRIDPQLFSPAVVTFQNLNSGNSFCFGCESPDVLRRSFAVGH